MVGEIFLSKYGQPIHHSRAHDKLNNFFYKKVSPKQLRLEICCQLFPGLDVHCSFKKIDKKFEISLKDNDFGKQDILFIFIISSDLCHYSLHLNKVMP